MNHLNPGDVVQWRQLRATTANLRSRKFNSSFLNSTRLLPFYSGSMPNIDEHIRLWCGELICMCDRLPSPVMWTAGRECRQCYTCKARDWTNSWGGFTANYKRVIRQKLSQPHSDLTHSNRRIFLTYQCFSVFSFIHSSVALQPYVGPWFL
jgi:hypothetical protein